MIPAWGWLVIAMATEAVIMLWLAAKMHDWGYEEGAAAMKKAWDECRKKERS